MKKKYIALSLALAMVFGVAGCASSSKSQASIWNNVAGWDSDGSQNGESPSQSLKPGETPTIEPRYSMGYVQSGNLTAWDKAATNNIQATAARSNIKLSFAEADNNQPMQKTVIETQLSTKGKDSELPKVLAFSPVVEGGWEDFLTAVQKTEVPVVVVGRPIEVNESLYSVYIHNDWTKQGADAATWLSENAKGTHKVIELQNKEEPTTSLQRHDGFAQAMGANAQSIQEISIVNSRMRAKTELINAYIPDYKVDMELPAAETLLATGDVIFAHSDDLAIGAIAALQEIGLEPGVDVTVISIGGSQAALDSIIEGALSASVEDSPLFGEALIAVSDSLAEGEVWDQKELLLQGKTFDAKNAVEAYPSRMY